MIQTAKKLKPLVAQKSATTASRQDQFLSGIFMLAGAVLTLITLSYISL